MSILKEIFTNKSWRKAFLTLLCALATYFFLPADLSEPARRMGFIFVVAAFFWALEIVPLYATSLIVVLLEILLLARPGGVLQMDKGGYEIFLLPFGSPIIMLFFGGLTLAMTLRKYRIDNLIATKLLKMFGKSPYFIMLGFMLATAFLSMWMSNTATTAMMIAMVLPLLKQIKETSPFRTALILSIPFAANIGGIATPVGTPPNAIAIGILADSGVYLNFTSWMVMALPLAAILLVATSFLLILVYPPQAKELNLVLEKVEGFDRKAVMVGVFATSTVVLWLTSSFHKIPSAVIALIAVGLFFTFKLIDREDLKKIDWDVLVLMWGGLALGKGLDVTGLTNWIVALPFFQQQGLLLVIIFGLLAVVLSTFMSNTATSNLLIPIVMVIPGENNVLLAIVVALSCSFAMALPISTPPNAIAFSTNMIKTKDMMKMGAIISFVSVMVVLLGYKFIIPRILGV